MIINGTDYDQEIKLAKLRIHEQIDGIKTTRQMVSEKSNLLIVSDGHANNTQIYCNGEILHTVTSIEIDEILPGQPLIARITIFEPKLRLRANNEH